MAHLDNTIAMGPLLRQYHEMFERKGEEVALAWADKLPADKQMRLAMEMQAWEADIIQQDIAATFRANIEKTLPHLGFTKN